MGLRVVSALAARLFSVWTALTCACCVFCALYIEERGIFLVTYASFIFALAFFATEWAIYGTVPFKFVLVIAFVTCTSIKKTAARLLLRARPHCSACLGCGCSDLSRLDDCALEPALRVRRCCRRQSRLVDVNAPAPTPASLLRAVFFPLLPR